jgi:NAD(P)-dependent dehydrogenase (short-subunit alcohol dehydrogenase family)
MFGMTVAHGITVVLVAPGPIETGMFHEMISKTVRKSINSPARSRSGASVNRTM